MKIVETSKVAINILENDLKPMFSRILKSKNLRELQIHVDLEDSQVLKQLIEVLNELEA